MEKKVAIFVDGGFFINRLRFYNRRHFGCELTAEVAVKLLRDLVKRHEAKLPNPRERYRLFYYDAPPFDKQIRLPMLDEGMTSKKQKNFKKDEKYLFQTALHNLLQKERKTALRMGKLSNNHPWQINSYVLKDLLEGKRQFKDLTNDDFYLDIKQKGVDARIGVDIATITLQGYIDTAVLIASDADFVPVAKLARSRGVDVILDPLYSDSVDLDLKNHIDAMQSFDMVSMLSRLYGSEPTVKPKWWN